MAPYSIDEAFLSVPTPGGTPGEVCAEMERRACEIRARVMRWTGVPVRVSWAETKTLAKAASEWAKVKLKAGDEQRALFDPEASLSETDRARRAALMEALDAANRRSGGRAVVVASQGCPATLRRTRAEEGAPRWEMRRERMTPRYTTRWDELAVVRS